MDLKAEITFREEVQFTIIITNNDGRELFLQ